MNNSVSDSLIRVTAMIAVGCYGARLMCDLSTTHLVSRRKLARLFWLMGAIALTLHIGLGFHFVHAWNHGHAYAHTAARTAAAIGWNWGGGLYINHAFTLLWWTDVCLWYRHGIDYPDHFPIWHRTVQSIFAFIMLNATVVFGPRYWTAIVAICVVFAMWYCKRYQVRLP